jgi:hypothetical protein
LYHQNNPASSNSVDPQFFAGSGLPSVASNLNVYDYAPTAIGNLTIPRPFIEKPGSLTRFELLKRLKT